MDQKVIPKQPINEKNNLQNFYRDGLYQRPNKYTNTMLTEGGRKALYHKKHPIRVCVVFGCTTKHTGSQFLDQGLLPLSPLHRSMESLTTRPPGKSPNWGF